MTEDEAVQWIADQFGQTSVDLLRRFEAIVRLESVRQNLVSRSTLATIWSRHIVDSAQLIALSRHDGVWLDIGTGAGFPGLVIACCVGRPIVLLEPRALRARFLEAAASQLGLAHAAVTPHKAQTATLTVPASTVSARAVGSLDMLFTSASRLVQSDAEWILPRGEGAASELLAARRSWHGTFHVKHSLLDPRSIIVVAEGVRPR